ncbi:MAG: tetratricopeptide repeat protein [Bdellovibrionota bacterium]
MTGCNANSPETKFQLAEQLLEDKKYDAAISEFQNIVDKSPNSNLGLEAELKIAQIQHLYLGRSQEAVDAYRQYLKRTKDENKKREIERILADIQFQSFENYDDAIASYTKLLKENKNETELEELLYRLGRSFFLKGQFADASKIFNFQKSKFPQGKYFWRAELEIGNSLSSQNKCADAIKQYDKVIVGGQKEERILASFAKAVCYEEQDDLDEAYELFSKIKDEYPAPTVVELKLQKIKRRKILRSR